jgi:hypothetical protein
MLHLWIRPAGRAIALADFSLSVGAVSETVEVQAVLGETVNRTSGEVSRTIDSAHRVNFANPNIAVNAGGYGTINSANPSRQMQIGVRLDF